MGVKSLLLPHLRKTKKALRLEAQRLEWSRVGVVIASGVTLIDVNLSPYVNIAHDAEIARASVGKRTSIGRYTKIQDAHIGSYCSISWETTIGATSHPMDHLASHAFWYRKQFGVVVEDEQLPHKVVNIGNDVWIGCDVVVMPGVSIGNGAVVGANSVVTKDVDPYCIVAGSPAKQIGTRFAPDIVERLQALSWWDWSEEELKQNLAFFEEPLTDEALAAMEHRA